MKSLILVVFVIILAGSVVLFFIGKTTEAIYLFVGSIVSLSVALFGYHQYQSAKEARTPVATIELREEGFLPSWFNVILHNHSNQTISGQCFPSAAMSGRPANLNTSVPAEPVEIRASEEKKIYDFSVAKTIVLSTNYMNHEEWLREENANPLAAIERMMIAAATDPQNAKNLFRFKITVQYRGVVTGVEGKPVDKEYYYEFHKRKLVDTSLPEA